jgi:hypothetical protein
MRSENAGGGGKFMDSLRKLGRSIAPKKTKVKAKPKAKVKAMTEAAFWRITEPYGWGTKTTNDKRILKDLTKKLSPEEAIELRGTYRHLYDKLSNAVEAYEAKHRVYTELGDDSFGDLIAHIIGMGKAEYHAALRSPARAIARARKHDFKESFAYALP